jgi:hypothetical protein
MGGLLVSSNLRHWLPHDVIAVIRDAELPASDSVPSVSVMQWPKLQLSLWHWQNESWMRMRDLSVMLVGKEIDHAEVGSPARVGSWKASARLFI